MYHNTLLSAFACPEFDVILVKTVSMGNVILASARSRLSSAQVCDTRQQPIVSQVCTALYRCTVLHCLATVHNVYRTFATMGQRQAVGATLTISHDARESQLSHVSTHPDAHPYGSVIGLTI